VNYPGASREESKVRQKPEDLSKQASAYVCGAMNHPEETLKYQTRGEMNGSLSRTIPDELKPSLPSIEEIERELGRDDDE
jgi:hypothetical protein